MIKCYLSIAAAFRASGRLLTHRSSETIGEVELMINARMTRNGKDASDLIGALVWNVRALQNQASRLSGDLRRLRRKIDATHRAADRLHHKIQSTHARIRILRSQDRLHRRRQRGPGRRNGSKSAVESN